MAGETKRLLILSVGYGKGHHSAARALAECYESMGWSTQIADVCEIAHPICFRLTQCFYDFCVRLLPWLWRVTYDLTDTADWGRLVRGALLRRVASCLRELLNSFSPDLIICTYPLFAYMLDELQRKGVVIPPYAIVVTDAREISRPWMCSGARLMMVPDGGSCQMVKERYALDDESVIATGFPVRSDFHPDVTIQPPSASNLKILYGAYRQMQGVENDIKALLSAFPQLELYVLAGYRAERLKRNLAEYEAGGRLQIMQATEKMAEYVRKSHFYIGKAGAATMFECYACLVPVLINYTLPGQEQGNLELLLDDECGCHVESTSHLIATVRRLLSDDAREWQQMRGNMKKISGTGAASRIACVISKVFGV